MVRFHMYVDQSGQFRWRLVDGNNRIVADGSEGYVSRQGCEKGIRNVVGDVVDTFVGGSPVMVDPVQYPNGLPPVVLDKDDDGR